MSNKKSTTLIWVVFLLAFAFLSYNQSATTPSNYIEITDYDQYGNIIQSKSISLDEKIFSYSIPRQISADNITGTEEPVKVRLPNVPKDAVKRRLSLVIKNTGNVPGEITIRKSEFSSINEVI